jgi:hypothetical protein
MGGSRQFEGEVSDGMVPYSVLIQTRLEDLGKRRKTWSIQTRAAKACV